MDQETFDGILNNRIKQIKEVLGAKAGEYAQRGDRLHNFKVAARANQVPPEQALWGMATKHLVSIMDLVNGDLCAKPAVVDEKIGDMINYLILLEAIFKEDIEEC